MSGKTCIMILEYYWSSKMMLGEFIQLDLAIGEIGSFGSLRKELRFIEMYYGENDLMVQIDE